MNITRRGVAAGLAALPLAPAWAQQAFPSKPLTLVVPFPAGGPADIFGRNLAQGMTGPLGQQVVPCRLQRPGGDRVQGPDGGEAEQNADAIGPDLVRACAGDAFEHVPGPEVAMIANPVPGVPRFRPTRSCSAG